MPGLFFCYTAKWYLRPARRIVCLGAFPRCIIQSTCYFYSGGYLLGRAPAFWNPFNLTDPCKISVAPETLM